MPKNKFTPRPTKYRNRRSINLNMDGDLIDRMREAIGGRPLSEITITLYERWLQRKKEEASQQRLLIEQVQKIVPKITNSKNTNDIKMLDRLGEGAWEAYFNRL